MPELTSDPAAEVRRHFRHNYLVHVVEGGFFMGGSAFVAPQSVLPAMLKSLGAPDWIISMAPMMMFFGFVGPSLLMAHRIERMPQMRPLVLLVCLFQRLPYLVAGLGLLLIPPGHPLLILALVAATPFISGFCGGISISAWFELVARTIPAQRRASLWAYRNIMTAVIGILAGGLVSSILATYPGKTGYGLLFLCCAALMFISYGVISRVREPSIEPHPSAGKDSLTENLRTLPALLREDPRLRRLILARFFASGQFIMLPFLAIHALEQTGKSESFLGYLVTMEMAGGIVGNLLAARLGDRYGGRFSVLIGATLTLAICLSTFWIHFAAGFAALFFVLGAGTSFTKVGDSTLALEICPVERRPTYMSLLMTLNLPGMLSAALLSTLIRHWTGSFLCSAFAAAVFVSVALYHQLRISDPRRTMQKDYNLQS